MTDAEHLAQPPDPERCYPGCPHTTTPPSGELDRANLELRPAEPEPVRRGCSLFPVVLLLAVALITRVPR